MLTAIDNNAGRRQRCDGDPVAPVYAGRQRRSDMTGGLRASGTELNRRAIDLSAMAHEVAAETSVLDAAREVEWVIASGIKVFADAALMRRLLQVLLGNAFRFSGDGRPARVEVGFRRVEACRIEIFVSDNGVGFDMQDGDRLFNPMRRPSADDPMDARAPDCPLYGGLSRCMTVRPGQKAAPVLARPLRFHCPTGAWMRCARTLRGAIAANGSAQGWRI